MQVLVTIIQPDPKQILAMEITDATYPHYLSLPGKTHFDLRALQADRGLAREPLHPLHPLHHQGLKETA